MSQRFKIAGGIGIGAILASISDVFLAFGDVILSFGAFLLVSIDQWLPMLSVAQSHIAPETSLVSSSTLETAIFVVALLFVGVSIARLLVEYRRSE